MSTAPNPEGVTSRDELVGRLQELRIWAGVGYRELHRRVATSRRERGIPEIPVFDTVRRCLQPGRRRLDVELVVDIVTALVDGTAAAAWRQACRVVDGTEAAAGLVPVYDTVGVPLAGLHGRDDELADILDLATPGDGTSAVVVAVEGMGGVGKTTLVTRAGHELAGRHDLGEIQLSVNLRGYDESLPPADPAAVLDGFLRVLGMPGSRIVRLDLAGRAAAFQGLVAGRRGVIVLDNAASLDQVLPLLPGAGGCVALVTSRHHLGLDRAHQVRLGVLDTAASIAVLADDLGDARLEAEPDAAHLLADMVGHLPLALKVVAARIRAMPGWSLADHVERLREARAVHRLEDGVEVALRLSYDAADPDQRSLLALLALAPVHDVDGYAAAALTHSDLAAAERLLSGLLDRHLLLQRSPGRFRLHDLVRTFAAARALDELPPTTRRAALTRLFEHQAYVATAAAHAHSPETTAWLKPRSPAGTPTPDMSDRTAADRWLAAEWQNLIATASVTADRDDKEVTVALSLALFRYLQTGGRLREAESLHTRAAGLAQGAERAVVLTALGTTYFPQARFAAAEAPLTEAAELYRTLGDDGGLSAALTNLGIVHKETGRTDTALECFREALARASRVGDPVRTLRALTNLGQLEARLGRDREAVDHFRRAHDLAVEVGDRAREAQTLVILGDQLCRVGSYGEALTCLERAHLIADEIGLHSGEPYLLGSLGSVHSALGEHDLALTHHEQAVAIARDRELTQAEVDALLAMGASLERAERRADAAECFRDAADVAGGLGLRAQEAAARDHLDRVLAGPARADSPLSPTDRT